jgi:cellulose synthase/poly-beta-1,6-N-acetylglucosamine synthase-like glycosyltransferase
VSQTTAQTYSNHRRLDPLFHVFVIPVFVVGVVLSLVHFFAHFRESDFRDNFHSFLLIVLALALLTLVFKTRLYALKVQDRVIRLEERLRLMQLLPDPLRARIPELTIDQLIALRFASDAELPALAQRAMNEKLKSSDIKKAIQNWRPDNWRV